MTDETGAADQSARSRIAAGDLNRVVELFGLGEVSRVSFIEAGMMNPNWRLETSCGVFALKRIVDVPLERARRSLNVLKTLGALGLPVCAPGLSSGVDGHACSSLISTWAVCRRFG